jgi:hypothetical protein
MTAPGLAGLCLIARFVQRDIKPAADVGMLPVPMFMCICSLAHSSPQSLLLMCPCAPYEQVVMGEGCAAQRLPMPFRKAPLTLQTLPGHLYAAYSLHLPNHSAIIDKKGKQVMKGSCKTMLLQTTLGLDHVRGPEVQTAAAVLTPVAARQGGSNVAH